jgi:ABC-type multidrug transport system fused ATPase/permease subunit
MSQQDSHEPTPAPPMPEPTVEPMAHPLHQPAPVMGAVATPPPPGAADRPDREAPAPVRDPDALQTRSRDGIDRPIQESEYFSNDPAAIQHISDHIDEYFNQPLDIFPFWESDGKPDRFHVLFHRQIQERFPVESDMRGRIHRYGRSVFRRLCTHVAIKRMNQALALIAFTLLATLGPTWFTDWTGTTTAGVALAAIAMVLSVGIYWGLNAILFTQYRFKLENDSYELSREIVQRTRELQNLFTNARAVADQAETQFQTDGKGWGQRAMYLTRLTMWLGARMEYLEKFVQMELWRVRRERYWMRWFSRFMTPLVFLLWLWLAVLEPVPGVNEMEFRILQGLAIVLGAGVSWMSYFLWQTPVAAIQDKLGIEGWVRYASLDVDNAVADQVRRDKERLVEYRNLTRGRI